MNAELLSWLDEQIRGLKAEQPYSNSNEDAAKLVRDGERLSQLENQRRKESVDFRGWNSDYFVIPSREQVRIWSANSDEGKSEGCILSMIELFCTPDTRQHWYSYRRMLVNSLFGSAKRLGNYKLRAYHYPEFQQDIEKELHEFNPIVTNSTLELSWGPADDKDDEELEDTPIYVEGK